MDGVLVEPASSPKRDSEIYALQQHGIDVHRDIFEDYKGLSSSDKIRKIIDSSNCEADPEKVKETKLETHLGKLDEVEEIQGISDIVEEISSNFATAVASNTERIVVKKTIEHIGLDGVFDSLVSSDDVKKGKPDPEMFLMASEEMGTEPERTVVIDDSKVGVQGASKGGFYTVGFEMNASEFADKTVANVGELKSFLEELE